MIFFTADTHFFHSNIINLCGRPFSNVEEMNNTLVHNWNNVVQEKDEVYILGDFIYKGNGEEANRILKRLKGKKYLILGNHDKFLQDDKFDESNFEWIKQYYVLDYKKMKFILFHYPILEWEGFFRKTIHLYGHVHNSGKDPNQHKRFDILGSNAINVGVDVQNFTPVSIERIIKMADR